jgi:hypothetical protein
MSADLTKPSKPQVTPLIDPSVDITDVVNTNRPPNHNPDGSVQPTFTVLGTVTDPAIGGNVVVTLTQNGAQIDQKSVAASANWSVSFNFTGKAVGAVIGYLATAEYQKPAGTTLANDTAGFNVTFPGIE